MERLIFKICFAKSMLLQTPRRVQYASRRLQYASRRLRHASRRLKDASRQLQEILLKHVDWKRVLVKYVSDQISICASSTTHPNSFKALSRCFKVLWTRFKTLSKLDVEADSSKTCFPHSVCQQIYVCASNHMHSRRFQEPSRRFKST